MAVSPLFWRDFFLRCPLLHWCRKTVQKNGAEKLSAFFKLIRLERHIGISPSTIKNICSKTCDLLEEYQKQQELKFQLKNPVKVVGGIDETYY